MKLYAYWRSSASWRVRIGLHLKQLPFEIVPVNLRQGEQAQAPHLDRNAFAQVPVLEREDGSQLTQSLAILQYLDALHPQPALFPSDPWQRAQVLALAEMVNAGIQPLQNFAVLKSVEGLGADRSVWARDVIQRGLEALQRNAAPHAGDFLFGDTVTLADLCLVPQLYNARRFDCDLSELTLLTQVERRCESIEAFAKAHPSVQPDAA